MSTDFEFSSVPGSVLVSWSLYETELSFVGGNLTMDVERDFDYAQKSVVCKMPCKELPYT